MKPLTDLETIRAQELLVQRATEGLDDAALAELERLGASDVESFDLAAAAVAVAIVAPEPMPASVADRLLAAAVRAHPAATPAAQAAAPSSTAPAVPAVAAQLPERGPARPRMTRTAATAPTGRRLAWWGVAGTGWAAAAALAAFVLTRSPGRTPAAPPAPAPAGSAASATPTPGLAAAVVPGPDPAGARVTGEVRWQPGEHRGQLHLRGLAVNDPRVARYQVWIVDGARAAGHAVDAGLFDVTADGDVRLSLATGLPVVRPVAVEVTLEAPIGAVVSTRDRLVARATFPAP